MDSRMIRRIIERLDKEPERVITSNLGSGSHARSYKDKEGNVFHKVVIPGDTFADAKMELHYLLFDLGIDVGFEPEELNQGSLI
jgi:hypothetical protein